MHAGFVDVAAAARRGLRWWLLRGRRVHGGQGCVCGCELLMVEGWWCESSGGALSAQVSQWCARCRSSRGGVLGRAPADRDASGVFGQLEHSERRAVRA